MEMKCRFCNDPLKQSFANLGLTPFANFYPDKEQIHKMEPFYPLHAYVCEKCYLVQLGEFQTPEQIFGDYAYFSSYSETLLKLSEAYAKIMIQRFGFDSESLVVEIASNDGYLLQYFKEREIPVLGIEPARNVAEVAQEAGIPTISKFFGVETATQLAEEGKNADLMIGNNVLAHVPDLNDFVRGYQILLKPGGVVTIEFPHLMALVNGNKFDTIYHEHFSYFSFTTVNKVFAEHGLTLFDVDQIPTHGGSLRIYARHADDSTKPISRSVIDLLQAEEQAGITKLDYYMSFEKKVIATKLAIWQFIHDAKEAGKTLVGYGAPAKANTLMNYCGVGPEMIDYVVDRSPHKQNRFLPGTHIPVYAPERVAQTNPDYLIIMAWNLKDEIMDQMSHIRDWGGRFVTLIPEVKFYN